MLISRETVENHVGKGAQFVVSLSVDNDVVVWVCSLLLDIIVEHAGVVCKDVVASELCFRDRNMGIEPVMSMMANKTRKALIISLKSNINIVCLYFKVILLFAYSHQTEAPVGQYISLMVCVTPLKVSVSPTFFPFNAMYMGVWALMAKNTSCRADSAAL